MRSRDALIGTSFRDNSKSDERIAKLRGVYSHVYQTGTPVTAFEYRITVNGVEKSLEQSKDNVVNQRVALGLLARRGHTVTVVGNGREALDALERDAYDLVLMDVQMPVMSGFEATAAIRTREQQAGGHVRTSR